MATRIKSPQCMSDALTHIWNCNQNISTDLCLSLWGGCRRKAFWLWIIPLKKNANIKKCESASCYIKKYTLERQICVFKCSIAYRVSVDWGVCVVVMVAIFSAFVSREALEDSENRQRKKIFKKYNQAKMKQWFLLNVLACSHISKRHSWEQNVTVQWSPQELPHRQLNSTWC